MAAKEHLQPLDIKAASELIKETQTIVLAVETLTNTVSQVLDRANQEIESLTEKEIRQNRKVREAYQDLQDAAQKAQAIVNKVDYITQIGSDHNGMLAITTKLTKTKTECRLFWRVRWLLGLSYTYEVPNPDYQCLKVLINRIQKGISHIEQAYLEFTESLQKALKTTENAIDDCKHCEIQARQKKRTVATTGVLTTTILGTLTAIATPIVGGPVLVGIGIGSTAAVAGGAVAYSYYEEYARLQEAFKKQHVVLIKWFHSACEMKKNVANVHQAVERLATVVDDLEQSQPDQIHINNLCCTLNQMTASFSDMKSTTMECRTAIRKAYTNMDTGLKKLQACN